MKPTVVIHSLVSVDGRIDGFPGDIGLYYQLAGRWPADALLSGSETILASEAAATVDDDNATAPAKAADDAGPLLVIVDSRGRVRCWSALLQAPYWRAGVSLCSRATPGEHIAYLERMGVDCIIAGDDSVDLPAALTELASRHAVKLIRVDSGGKLNGALLRAGLVDEVSVLIDPHLVGSHSPRSLFEAPAASAEASLVSLQLKHCEQFDGGAVWLRYDVRARS